MAKNTGKYEEEPLTPGEIYEEENNNPDKQQAKKLKKLFLTIAPIILTIAGAIYFFFFVIKAQKNDEGREIFQSKGKQQIVLESNTYLDLDTIIVGLAPSGNKKEDLRLNLSLRLSSEHESEMILKKMPIIKDTLITFLRSLRATDFNSSSSTLYLKEEISKRINKITAPIVIKEVLFQEITVK